MQTDFTSYKKMKNGEKNKLKLTFYMCLNWRAGVHKKYIKKYFKND